jgi:hypothetical protein
MTGVPSPQRGVNCGDAEGIARNEHVPPQGHEVNSGTLGFGLDDACSLGGTATA